MARLNFVLVIGESELSILTNIKDSEIRSLCKEKIESLEHWLRRLIDDTLTPIYGDYFLYSDQSGNRLIKKSLAEQVARNAERVNRYVIQEILMLSY